ncbi:MAG: DMT family transporter [Clostridia bacterium]|nr:DMT family transporter [Clostridia bacterium]
MIYLILAILCSSCLALAFALAGKLKLDTMNITLINYIAACGVSAFNLFREISGGIFSPAAMSAYTLPIAICAGAAALAGFWFIQRSVVANGPSATTMFSKLAMVIPVLVSVLFLNEEAGLLRWIGILLAVISLVLYNWDGGFKVNGLLLGVWLTDGWAILCSNLFARTCNPVDNTFYLTVLFGTAAVLAAVLIIKGKGPKITLKEISFGFVLGVLNLGNIGFMVKSLQVLPTSIVSPVIAVGVILITAIAGRLFFGETFKKRKITALGITIAALVILNI